MKRTASKTNPARSRSFVSRAGPKNNLDHVILGVLGYKPREFAAQMNLNLNNGWAIVRTFVDMVMKESEADGKYVLVKDPNKPTIRLYQVPRDTFEEDEGDEGLGAGAGSNDGVGKVEEDAAEE